MNTLSIDMHDNVIMQAAQEDPEQFAPIYDRYFSRIYSYCRRRVNNPQVAEDLCSQIFERVLKSRHTYRLDGNFRAWLFRIAHNVIYDYYQHKPQIVDIDTVQIPDDHRPIEFRETIDLLNTLIAELNDEEREILLLSIDGGLTSQEIGDIIGKKQVLFVSSFIASSNACGSSIRSTSTMNDKKQPEHLEEFILDLHDNEHALPDGELDDDLADFTRLLVTQRKENEMAKERVWTTVTASGKSTPNFQRWLVFAAAILSVAFIGGLLLLPDEKHQFGQSLDTTPTINENAIAQTDFAMATSTSTFTSTVAPTQTVTTTSTSTWTPSSTVTSTSTPPATRLIADTDRPLIVTATVSDPAATATAIILTFEASQGTFQPSSPTFKTPLLIIDEELPLSLTLNIERIDFVNQTWNNGGPAALSMLLSYYDVDISQLEIASALRPNAEDKNTTFAEIEAYMRSANFANFMSETFFSGANESVLKRAIGTGYPVLVSTGYEVDESNGWFAQYLLVVGYDTAGFQVIDPYLNTSSEPLHIPYDEFDSQWQEMNRPLMLVYPQGDSMIIQTIVGGFSDAQQASNIALQKVIEDLALNAEDGWAWFNLGDSLLAMGSSEAAVAAFDKAIELGLPSRAFWYRTSIFEAYLLGERYNDIIRLTNDVLKSTSDVEETYIYRALAYDAQGMTEKAAENAQQAYELNPGHPMLDNLKSYYGSTPSND